MKRKIQTVLLVLSVTFVTYFSVTRSSDAQGKKPQVDSTAIPEAQEDDIDPALPDDAAPLPPEPEVVKPEY